MARFNRRAGLTALGASAVMGIGYALRGILGSPVLRIRLTDGGMMGVDAMDMSRYSEMFNRHSEITRTVEEKSPAVYAPPLNQIRLILWRNSKRTCPACTPTSTEVQRSCA
jgi:hypothetical protein